jgi:hypothetical protein
MIKYMQHEPKYFDFQPRKCKYCGICLLFNNKTEKYEPKFSVSCITEDEYIIKSIIE